MHDPRLADVVQHGGEQFEYDVIGWKRAKGLGDFPQVHVHRPNRVVRVNCFSDAGGVVKARRQARPVALPGLANRRELWIPLALEFREPGQSLVLGGRAVNQSQIGSDFHALFPAREVQVVAHHLNQAELPGVLGNTPLQLRPGSP